MSARAPVMTATADTCLLPRERNAILGALILLAAAGWGVLTWQSATMDGDMSPTMGMAAPLFIAIWVAMMAAMMYPTAAPMVLMFARVQAGKRDRGHAYVPGWLFVAAYMAVWTAFGAAAYPIALGAERLADESAFLMDNAARIGGGVLVLAGVYQATPLKFTCLSKCRTPMTFVMTAWRDGAAGAFRMGVEHGAYCLGCCWLLFVILFPLGMMNVAAMALVTALIFAEKSLPLGRQAALLGAVGLVVYGVIVIVHPGALPTVMSSGMSSEMPGGGAM